MNFSAFRREVSFFLAVWLGQLIVVAYSITDTVIVGNRHPEWLGGLALGNAVYVPTIMTATALLSSITINIARQRGAGPGASTKGFIHCGFGLGALVSILVSGILFYFAELPGWSDGSGAATVAARQYVNALALGVLPSMIFRVVICIANAARATYLITMLQGLGLLVKVALTNVFIDLMPPRFGLMGCGLATSLVFGMMGVGGLMLIQFRHEFADFRIPTLTVWPSLKTMSALCRTSIPLAIATFSEVSAFGYMSISISRFGATQLEAHQIVSNLNNVGYTFSSAFGVVVSVSVSRAFGSSGARTSDHTAVLAIWGSVTLGIILAISMSWLGNDLLALYTKNVDILVAARRMLTCVSLVQFADCVQTSAAATLRARALNILPTLLQIAGLWIGIGVLGNGLASHGLNLPLHGTYLGPGWAMWFGVAIGLMATAFAMSLAGIGRGRWQLRPGRAGCIAPPRGDTEPGRCSSSIVRTTRYR